jgi:hypothetical protein
MIWYCIANVSSGNPCAVSEAESYAYGCGSVATSVPEESTRPTSPCASVDSVSPCRSIGKTQDVGASGPPSTMDSFTPDAVPDSSSVVSGKIPGYDAVEPETCAVTPAAPASDQLADSPDPSVSSASCPVPGVESDGEAEAEGVADGEAEAEGVADGEAEAEGVADGESEAVGAADGGTESDGAAEAEGDGPASAGAATRSGVTPEDCTEAAGAPAEEDARDTPTELACSCQRPSGPATSVVLIGCQLPAPSW